MSESEKLFARAKTLMPGGVNSPVRAFHSVGGVPRFIDHASGAYLFDVDGNRYVDYVLSWGPLILGHADEDVVNALTQAITKGTSYGAPTRVENELAEQIIAHMPSIEMIRFVNSGTEACMSALRLARAYTGRCYHGHADMLLVQAGSGAATLGLPDSPGVPAATTAHTLIAPFNNLQALSQLFEQFPDQIAGVIIEPVAGNMGLIPPEDGYLQAVQSLCAAHGALFILDEVMTGFRVAMGGAQALYQLSPDITCLGKVIGGGLPVGAYGGKRHIMEHVAPSGKMYQAGTLSGNPLAMTAGLVTLRKLAQVFDQIASRTTKLAAGLAQFPLQVAAVGTMFGFYFLNQQGITIRDYDTAKRYADTAAYARFFHHMLERGFYFAPSQFEAGFLSLAHTDDMIDDTLKAIAEVIN
ncbi:MAG: glutamate-1-semialdehyde-2,1-aminomutase [Phototrophicales bacterium]|nr:MAG: glutamate-1-semialdehyde-2,1-aminomutase [Phototrophicales bacterium]